MYTQLSKPDKSTKLSAVASGISYLHDLPIPVIHGDIRGASPHFIKSSAPLILLPKMNIFVDRHGKPVVGDFGCAKLFHLESSGVVPPSNVLFSARWAPPEGLETGQYAVTLKADVYSFACLCIEVNGYWLS